MLMRSRSQLSVSKMAGAQQSVNFALLSLDDYNCIENAVLSISAVNTDYKGRKKPFWRAVLTVKGGKNRVYGTKRGSAVESAQKLLSKYPDRISAAEKKRVLEVLQGDVRPRKHGSQPRSSGCVPIIHQGDGQGPVPVFAGPLAKLCRRLRGKRKLNHEDCVQNPRATKKIAILAEPVGKVSDPVRKVAPPEKGKVGDLHYFLRMPLQTEEDLDMPSGSQPSGQPAPLLLFLHGSGERGKDNGSELYKVCKHGPWKCVGADQFFILAPQCPRNRVWPTFVDEVLLVLKDVCERHVVDKSRIYITGLSMGAFGAWSLAVSQPQMFAAIVSICGGFIGAQMPIETNRSRMLKLAEIDCDCFWVRQKLKKCEQMPAWLFHGMKDRIIHPKCSEFVFNALGGTGNENVRRTTYRDAGHHCWGKAYNTLDLYTWLLKHSRRMVR